MPADRLLHGALFLRPAPWALAAFLWPLALLAQPAPAASAAARVGLDPAGWVERIRQAAGRWVWPLQMAYAVDQPPTPEQSARLRASDLVVLPASEENIAAVPREMAGRVLFEFDPALPPANIARRMNRLEADGFRQFGVAGFPESLMGPIFPSLSLRWQPQLR